MFNTWTHRACICVCVCVCLCVSLFACSSMCEQVNRFALLVSHQNQMCSVDGFRMETPASLYMQSSLVICVLHSIDKTITHLYIYKFSLEPYVLTRMAWREFGVVVRHRQYSGYPFPEHPVTSANRLICCCVPLQPSQCAVFAYLELTPTASFQHFVNSKMRIKTHSS